MVACCDRWICVRVLCAPPLLPLSLLSSSSLLLCKSINIWPVWHRTFHVHNIHIILLCIWERACLFVLCACVCVWPKNRQPNSINGENESHWKSNCVRATHTNTEWVLSNIMCFIWSLTFWVIRQLICANKPTQTKPAIHNWTAASNLLHSKWSHLVLPS